MRSLSLVFVSRCVQREGVVDFDELPSALTVDFLEVEFAYLAEHLWMSLEEVCNLLAPQFAVALPHKVPSLKQAPFGRCVIFLVCRYDKLLNNFVIVDRLPQRLGDLMHALWFVKKL